MSDGSVTIDTKLNNDGLKSGLSKIGSIAKAGLVGATAAVGSVATAFSGLVIASVNARGEIEQSIGGVETLFKDSADKVIKNANNAYKTAGMSANEYMQNVTSFSASLLQSVAGDTSKAADVADMAMVDMSDNANKMGTSMQDIQNAYQGFAKQNYTMLDNLKLGYGGTKTEMERLLKDAQNISGIKYDINNLSDVYNAIHVIQGELGITGTTAKEAAGTLQGSVDSFKASWENFLSGAGNINDVIDTGKIALENIIRVAKEAISDIGGELQGLLEEKLQPIRDWINEHQTLLTVLAGVVGTLTAAIIAYTISQNLAAIAMGIFTGAISIATAVSTAFGAVMAFITSPITLVVLAIGALITIIVLLVKNWDTVKEKALEVWDKIKTSLSETIDKIVEWFKELPYTIGYFIGLLLGKIVQFGIDAWNWVTTKIPEIINGITDWFKKLPENIKTHLTNVINRIINWGSEMKSKGKTAAKDLFNAVKDTLENLPEKIKEVGTNIVHGLWNGITGAGDWIKNKVSEFAKGILDGMKSALGIHSPSRLFRDEVGKYIALGVGEGFENNISKVYKQMKSAVDFETQKLNANLTASSVINVQRNSSIQSRLESIDNNREIVVKAETNLDGKVLTSTVNRVNAKQKLQYGIA